MFIFFNSASLPQYPLREKASDDLSKKFVHSYRFSFCYSHYKTSFSLFHQFVCDKLDLCLVQYSSVHPLANMIVLKRTITNFVYISSLPGAKWSEEKAKGNGNALQQI